MLKEEQAAELLRRCEAVAGRELKQTRGNLRRASTRAAAVWELIVAEAAAQLGRVEYEASQGGPDIRLELPTGRWVSIEVAYLYPRFEDEEQRCSMVAKWMYDAAASMGPNPPEIRCEFHGDYSHPAGPKITLPLEQDRKRFLASPEVAQFLAAVAARSSERHQARLTDYSVTLTAAPRQPGSHGFLSFNRPHFEAPKAVNEHAVFRALSAKLQQHKVDEPHLVCVGSDVSHALSTNMSGLTVRLEHALGAAVHKSGELSGALVVNIEQSSQIWSGISRAARSTAYPIKSCRHPLTELEWAFIQKLDLNRWKYTFPLSRKETHPKHRRRHASGSLGTSSTSGGNMKLTIPTYVLVDVLAGRKQLLDDYGPPEDNLGRMVRRSLQEGWSIVGCDFQAGDVQQAKAASVVLELAPPHEPVFWPREEEKGGPHGGEITSKGE